ncbi:FkbM family methyltransferase [Mesorhizobium sp. KR9-304]|uniref:FkbM family methyltransferase n=1 Tax=Mesorhizobium sp. KR9-304 TaxID=3156614 RepID=UPI0032B4AE64
MTVPEGYALKNGLLWPAEDEETRATLHLQVGDIATVCGHCRDFGVAVQAGGNVGIWPKDLGERFRVVYTFEPDPVNFRCLAANAPAENVFKFNAALGSEYGCVDLVRNPRRAGSHHVAGAGQIPTLRIDDLQLGTCDLIYLDVEGYEKRVLMGAADTIDRCGPTIAVEDRPSSERYGVSSGATVEWVLDRFNYRIAERLRRDVVMVPN